VRIDFITTFGIVAGFPSFPEAVLARGLQAEGHHVRVLTYYAKSSPMIDTHHAVIDGIEVHRLRRKGLVAPGSLRYIIGDAPDVAHIHHLSNRLSTLAMPAYAARRVPVVFSPHGILHDPELVADTDRPLDAPIRRERVRPRLRDSMRVHGRRHGAFVWALHRPLFVADAIHAISMHEKRVLIDLGVPAERIHFIPNGIDASLVATNAAIARTATPTVLFLGQTKYRKGWDVLVRAIPAVRACVPDAAFIFAGHTDRDRSDFDRLVAELNVRAAIQAVGRVSEEEKIRLLRSAWALALPARYEGFGIPLVEAMMVGTPVVTTDVPACNEIVTHGQTGLVVPPTDPAALADALVRLLTDRSLRERLGTQGARVGMERYAAPVVARQFADLYASIRERGK